MHLMEQTRAKRADRVVFYATRLTTQSAQNILIAALFVVSGTGSHVALDLSSLFLATLLPSLCFGFLGGAVVDRIGPARGFAFGAILRLLVVAAGAFFIGSERSVWVIAFAFSTASQVFYPAELALVRTIQSDATRRAHSVLVVLQYAGQGLGMLVLAPVLYLLGGPGAMLAGAAVGLVLASALSITLWVRMRRTEAVAVVSSRQAFTFGETVRFFRTEARARYALVVTTFKVVVSRGLVVALPLYLQHDLRVGRDATALLFVPGVIGAVIGVAWCSRTVTLERTRETMRLALLGMIVAMLALSLFDGGLGVVMQLSRIGPIVHLDSRQDVSYFVALPVAFLLGLSLSGAIIGARVALTETAPLGQQARVFAVQETITEAFLLLPLLAAGLAVQFAGPRVLLAAIGGAATIAFLVMERSERRRVGEPQMAIAALDSAVV